VLQNFLYHFTTAAFSWLPALNFGVILAGMLMGTPVFGFLPIVAALLAVQNVPNPSSLTSSPPLKAAVMALMMASSAFYVIRSTLDFSVSISP
jgi:hypothetical protein